MRSLTFDEVFAILSAVRWSAAELARLRAWLAGAVHPDECIALIEQAARGRPCPHCRCPRSHRCGQASGLQRFRCLGCRRSYNALTGTPLARLRKKERWLDYLQCVLGRGPVTPTQLFACLQPVLAADVLLVSDAAAVYRRFAARAGISHEVVNATAGGRARGAIHIQNVNGWHSRFKTWLVRFRGVASHYLSNYSGWQRLLDARQLTTPAKCLCAAARPG